MVRALEGFLMRTFLAFPELMSLRDYVKVVGGGGLP